MRNFAAGGAILAIGSTGEKNFFLPIIPVGRSG
jgi:hypothetical protein